MTREHIIDDDTPHIITPDGLSTGYEGMFTDSAMRASGGTDFPAELLIPEHEWQARAEEQEQQKSSLFHIIRDAGWTVKNQRDTNYCWCFSPVSCVEMLRVVQNQPYVSLSPASVGGPVTGYKNRGGWGQDALRYIAASGVAPTAIWPDTAIQKSFATPQAAEAAKDNKATEWMILRPRSLTQVVSLLLRRIPVSGGYDWWQHQISLVAARWKNGQIVIDFANSWGTSYGIDGYGTLAGNKRVPADAVSPRVVTAS